MQTIRSTYKGKVYIDVSFKASEFISKLSYDSSNKRTAAFLRNVYDNSSFKARVAINGGLFKQWLPVPTPVGAMWVFGDEKGAGAEHALGATEINPTTQALAVSSYGRGVCVNADYWASNFSRQGAFSLINNYEIVSTQHNRNLYEESDLRTSIGVTNDTGEFTIHVVCTDQNNKVTGAELAEFYKNVLYCKYAVALDGGGSTSLWVDGQDIISSTRAITDCIVFGEEIAQPSGETGYSLNTTKQAVRIRDSLVSGTVKTTVGIGNKVSILNFIPGIQSDGYQWCQSLFNGVKGYSQIDTFNCYTVTKDRGDAHPLYITTVGMKMRLRESVVNGREITMIPQGSRVLIVNLINGLQSDGYQWAYCNFNGLYGYCQIDTAVYTLTK